MVLTIATDSSGIEAPLQALKQMKIPFVQKFACEINNYCNESSSANYDEPENFYTDITKRNHKELPKNIDLYVCGFPCQSFSIAGKKLGKEDPRGLVLNHVIKTIKHVQPKIFILENVKGFKSINDGEIFHQTLDKLKKFNYSVYDDVLNTKNYGIPQNRERLFLIGIRNDVKKYEYKTPKKINLKENAISKFIEKKPTLNSIPKSILETYKKHKHKVNKNKEIILSTGSFGTANNISPTISHSYRHYIYKQKRYMTAREALKLQGFPSSFKKVVSESQLYKQAGNTMSVNVLKKLFNEVFRITNLSK